jgi:hypothetical protein
VPGWLNELGSWINDFFSIFGVERQLQQYFSYIMATSLSG